MIETYLEHYVISGGWTMLVLLPASVAAVAVIVRGWLLLNRSHIVSGVADESSGESDTRIRQEPLGNDTAVGRTMERLNKILARTGQVSTEDVRAEIAAETISLYAQFHFLVVVYALAPLVGLLGSIQAVMTANLDVVAGGGAERLAAAVERALVPTLWGIGVACVAYAGYAVLRLRLFHIERTALGPAVEELAAALTKDAFGRSRQPHETRSRER